ncbi:DNA/RNA non-specific endonuclease [Streptococcus uberis]|uniref:DNA/RNA non-specific endonuclease n=1 Tax=Streptococcus uberis TaxID=1349 RepID=UPI0021503419|nr:DNA/RNA non-specific endonuclease [Streptococcus uberis]MCR4252966.1 DNA/RNA non-specific endonuclease [Streptococcus uberis]MCR4254781.1 DNA/RNA non-specific endonuclease [Streptococcus uberis]MCR4259600.1 DNA/RNA non-specific endonuclease [Streptococcus uberis]MCR4262215.1 DNA/RNA non-specific endonuclease [Streptococcus uberis]
MKQVQFKKPKSKIGKSLFVLTLAIFAIILVPFLPIIGLIGLVYFGVIKKEWKKAGLALALTIIGISINNGLAREKPQVLKKEPTVEISSDKKTKKLDSLPSSKKLASSSTSAPLVLKSSVSTGSSAEEVTPSSTSQTELAVNNIKEPVQTGDFTFTGQKQLYLAPLDQYGRATMGHIQLQDKDEPTDKRAPYINYNPVGWKNFKLYYGDGTKQAWLMNRGHLIGYQFSGLKDEPKNLVPMTAWLNVGNYAGWDQGNKDSVFYYEQQLDSWLSNHPNYWLDYKVQAIYTNNEVIPRQIKLSYFGLDEKGKPLEIHFNSDKESTDAYFVTSVTLENQSPNATIDYLAGTAVGTVAKAEPPVVPSTSETLQAPPANQAVAPESDPIVYIAGHGTSDVYWFDKSNMPPSTKLENVVEMPLSQAIANGKRHSLNE